MVLPDQGRECRQAGQATRQPGNLGRKAQCLGLFMVIVTGRQHRQIRTVSVHTVIMLTEVCGIQVYIFHDHQ